MVVALIAVLLGLLGGSLGDDSVGVQLECNVRIKYLHVQEMSDRYWQAGSNISTILKPALQNISDSFPGSTFGVWRMQDKQNPSLYCAQQDLRMITDMTVVNNTIDAWSTITRPTYNGGSTADELLGYLPFASEAGWEVGDDQTNDPSIRVIKIIGIATSDAAFYYGDGFSNDVMSAYSPEYAVFGSGYHPQDNQKCHSTSYPELSAVGKALVDHDVYPLIISPGTTVSAAMDASQQLVYSWWGTHFGTGYLNVANRATVMTAGSSEQLINAIMTAASRADCTTTTTTVNVNCDMRLQYIHLLQRNDAHTSIADGVKPLGDYITQTYPGSSVGLWSTLPRTAGSANLELALTTDGSQLSPAVDSVVARTADWSQHVGSGFTDLLWYVPLTKDSGWETTDKTLWDIPAMKILSLVVSDGDWFAEDGNPTNDGNGYDLSSTVFTDGSYDPRNSTQRSAVSNQDLKSIRDSILNNNIYVMVTASQDSVSPGFDKATLVDWWNHFLSETLQLPADRAYICDADDQHPFVQQCVEAMIQAALPSFCSNDVRTTTPTPTPPTFTTVPPTSPCAQRYQVILITTESASFESTFADTKNDVRYFAKYLLTNFPGSSLGVLSSQNKQNACVTTFVPQSDDINTLLQSIDDWKYTGSSTPDVQGTDMSELMWFLNASGSWDVSLGQDYASTPKVKVLALLTDDGTFFRNDGVATNTYDQFPLPYDEYPNLEITLDFYNVNYNKTIPGYDPRNETMCQSTSYPVLKSTGASILGEDAYVVLLYPDANTFHSTLWDVAGARTATTAWWDSTFSEMGLEESRHISAVAGVKSLTNEVGENLATSLSQIIAFTCTSTTTRPPCPETVQFMYIFDHEHDGETVQMGVDLMAANVPQVVGNISLTYPGSSYAMWSTNTKLSGNPSKQIMAMTTDAQAWIDAYGPAVNDTTYSSNPLFGSGFLEVLNYVITAAEVGWVDDPNSLKLVSFYGRDGDHFYHDGITNHTDQWAKMPLPYLAYPDGSFTPANLAMKTSTNYPAMQSLRDAIMENNIHIHIYAIQYMEVMPMFWKFGQDDTTYWNHMLRNILGLPQSRFQVSMLGALSPVFTEPPTSVMAAIDVFRVEIGGDQCRQPQ